MPNPFDSARAAALSLLRHLDLDVSWVHRPELTAATTKEELLRGTVRLLAALIHVYLKDSEICEVADAAQAAFALWESDEKTAAESDWDQIAESELKEPWRISVLTALQSAWWDREPETAKRWIAKATTEGLPANHWGMKGAALSPATFVPEPTPLIKGQFDFCRKLHNSAMEESEPAVIHEFADLIGQLADRVALPIVEVSRLRCHLLHRAAEFENDPKRIFEIANEIGQLAERLRESDFDIDILQAETYSYCNSACDDPDLALEITERIAAISARRAPPLWEIESLHAIAAARALLLLGRADEAIAATDSGLRWTAIADQTRQHVRWRKSRLCLHRGQGLRAIGQRFASRIAFEKAVRLDPNSVSCHITLLREQIATPFPIPAGLEIDNWHCSTGPANTVIRMWNLLTKEIATNHSSVW